MRFLVHCYLRWGHLWIPILVRNQKVRFILAVVEERLQVNNRKKADLLKELKQEGYDLFLPA